MKLILAPSLVVLASLAARRWGDRLGGFVAGFPIVAGPILLFFGLEQGWEFTAGAAVGTLLGLVSLSAFCVVYVLARSQWWANLLTGWAAFGLVTWMLHGVWAPWWAAWLVAALALAAALYFMPDAGEARKPANPGRWDLPLRAASAAALVLALTGLAQALGASLSGLLTPFPVASSVLAAFAQRRGGLPAAEGVLSGMLLALQAFAAFCAALALLLPRTTLFLAFSLALLACALVQGALLYFLRKRG